MAFMEPQIEQGEWIEVESDCTDFIPADVVGNVGLTADGEEANEDNTPEERWAEIVNAVRIYISEQGNPDRIQSVRLISGFGARLSAPGYMDCTEWSVFATEEEAREYLVEVYGDDEEDNEGGED
jgi:hypothetical protein